MSDEERDRVMEETMEGPAPRPLGEVMKDFVADLAAKREARRAAGGLPEEKAPEGTVCPLCRRPHECWVCHDRHWISIHDPAEPVHSRYAQCTGPVCLERRRQRYVGRLEATEISEYGDVSLATFRPLPWQRAAYDVAGAYVQRSPHGLLYLVGNNGSGKSHLAVGIARAMAEAGHSALFYRTTTLLAQMRASYDPEAPPMSLMQLMATLRDVECLVLDDFGRERMTKWSEELFFDLLDHRYVNAREKATVITSNCKLSHIEEGLGSRLVDVYRSQVCLLIGGVDLRVRPLYEHNGRVPAPGERAQFSDQARPRAEHVVKEGVRICHVCNCLPCHPDCTWWELRDHYVQDSLGEQEERRGEG